MNIDDLSPELKEKARACKTTEDLLELAKSEGIELSDEQLEKVSGGWSLPCHDDVPGCGSFTSD